MTTTGTDITGETTAGVHATIAAYAHALDSGRTDDVVATFLPDGTSEITGMATFSGAAQLREGYAGLAPQAPQLHLVANTVVTPVTDTEATATSGFSFFARGEDGWSVGVTGSYDDVLQRTDEGRWLFRSRVTTFRM